MGVYGDCFCRNMISRVLFLFIIFEAIEISNVTGGNSRVWREEKQNKVDALPGAKEPIIEQVTCDMDCLYRCSYENPAIACSFNAIDNTCTVFDTQFVTFIEDANSVARIRSMLMTRI